MTTYDADAARIRIADLVLRTPAVESEELSRRTGGPVWLKLENLQHTGSFKVRGAANKLLALTPEERARGVVACSSGNHGRGVAYVAERLGVPAVVCVPEWIDRTKLDAIRGHGAEAVLAGATYDDAEAASIEIGNRRGLTYVHPFDDPDVIAGQGTVGLELLEQVPAVHTVVVPLSGGGLIGGMAVAIKERNPNARIVAASAMNANVMYRSVQAGHPIQCAEDETLATALSGGIGVENAHTFELVRDYVDEHVLIGEDEIRAAITFSAREHHIVVEGGGATAIAAILSASAGEGAVVAVVSGGNIDCGVFAKILTV
jgi:threonine dehydratase